MDNKDKMEDFFGSKGEAILANKKALEKILEQIRNLERKSAEGENVAAELRYEMALIKKIKEEQKRLEEGN